MRSPDKNIFSACIKTSELSRDDGDILENLIPLDIDDGGGVETDAIAAPASLNIATDDLEILDYFDSNGDPDLETLADSQPDSEFAIATGIRGDEMANTSDFTSGVFTVEEGGTVEIDFLYDGGKYKFELAIFSLTDIDAEPGSEEFIAEASQRALSDSELGHKYLCL